ncbi:MAG: M12 family metallo-peptidase [Planctomycetota bacterium]
MIVLPMLVFAASQQPAFRTIDRPFDVLETSPAGITALSETHDWHIELQDATGALIADFPLGGGASVVLDLERREVFAPGADLRLGAGGKLDRPDIVLLGGEIAGEPGSLAFLAFGRDMTLGFVQSDGQQYVVSSGPVGEGLGTVVYNLSEVAGETIPLRELACTVLDLPGTDAAAAAAHAPGAAARGEPPCRVVDVAVETDLELRTELFGGDAAAASDYVAALVGAVGEIYRRDLNVILNMSFLRIWDGSNDPWSGGDTVSQLFEFRDYWLSNETAVDRDLAHLLSGRALGGGVAWLGVVCNPEFGFAVSANLNGFFPYPLEDQNNQNWDVMVTAHEWGHNFGGPHTHEQTPLANIDGCGLGDCSTLPGTIMSYCHLCGDGTGDVDLRFHPQNIGDYMLQHLQFGAACSLTDNPICEGGDCAADVNEDGVANGGDFFAWVNAFGTGAPPCDVNGDGSCSGSDFFAWVSAFGEGC